jgi:phosphopantothenoylcysteine decarboxylase/phosphopantothenate--cysteine ligase
MLDAVLNNLPGSDFIVKAAAVGDYRSSVVSEHKMKRSGKGDLTLELTQNPDIASRVGENKKDGQVLIGFAAESEDLVKNAEGKLLRKRLDFIVVNDITANDAGFQSDTNSVQVIGHSGIIDRISGPKSDVAYDIWNIVTGKEA